MTTTGALRGMAWDHPRATLPLAAISAEWSRGRGVDVHWDARPLKDFEDQPLEQLTEKYDLVLIDYPFTGTAAASGLIVPADDWTGADYLADQRVHSVGPSFASYTWYDSQWALAVDAACQVSTWRPDLIAVAGLPQPPATWDAVAELAASLGNGPCRVALPLNPNHAYCTFLSLGIAIAGHDFWRPGQRLDDAAAREALGYLRRVAPTLHPLSRSGDPIAVSDCMSDTDEILYAPLQFGYASYSRKGFRRHMLQFGNAPLGPSGERGSVLGGVGVALSHAARDRDAAAALARCIASPSVQAGLYVNAGGQPGHAAAWESVSANRMTFDFFTATRATIEGAFLRPRVTGHRQFQELAGQLLHQFVWQEAMTAENCVSEFRNLVAEHLDDW